MALTLTIGGASKTLKAGSLTILQTANGRSTASFTVTSLDASYRPALNADVIIEETPGPVRIFGGLVTNIRERGVAEQGGVAIFTDITASDYHAYIDRRIVSIAIVSGSLEAAMTALLPYLSGYGVSIDAGQVTGPTLPALAYTVQPLSFVIEDIIRHTAAFGEPFVSRIDYSKVWSLFQPTTTPAPFDIEDPLPILEARSDIVVEHKRDSTYANRVIVYVPPTSEAGRTETFTGDGIADTFALQFTLTSGRGYVTNNGVFETLGAGATWEYDALTNSITRTSPPVSGAVITIVFDGTYTTTVAAEDATEIASVGVWERLLTVEEVPEGTTAQDIADAELEVSKFPVRTVSYTTIDPTLFPGQSQTIDVARRNLSAVAGVVTDIRLRDLGRDLLQRTVQVTVDGSQTNLRRGWRDVIRQWSSDRRGSGGTPSAVAALPSGGAPGPPVGSVQFHAVGGGFGGDAAFTYDPDTDTLICGPGCTATSTQGCQVFGVNNHIAP